MLSVLVGQGGVQPHERGSKVACVVAATSSSMDDCVPLNHHQEQGSPSPLGERGRHDHS
jgi:hypothetical protein